MTPSPSTTVNVIGALAGRARTDPVVATNFLLAREGHQVYPHALHYLLHESFRVCKKAGKHLAVAFPPEHAKTQTYAKRLAWEVGRNPNLRVALVSGDIDNAKRNLIAIRQTLMSRAYRSLFPGVVPDTKASKHSGEWSKERLYLAGNASPTFEVFPFEGAAEGARVDIIWCDDVVTRECMLSEAARVRARSAIHGTWLSRVTGDGFVLFTNNIWHRADPIHAMRDSTSFMTLWLGYEDTDRMWFEATGAPPDWKYGRDRHYLPRWEEVWPKSRLESRKGEDYNTYIRLFETRPINPSQCRFPSREEWARWHELPEVQYGPRIYAFLDTAGGREADRDCFAAVVLIMATPSGDRLVLDCLIDRCPPRQQVQMAYRLHRKWMHYRGIHELRVEVLKKDELWIRPVIEGVTKEYRDRGDSSWRLNWNPVVPREPKPSRIERLGPAVQNGWLQWPADLEDIVRRQDDQGRSFKLLVEQMEDYPFADFVDGPDALSGAMDASDAMPKRPLATQFEADGRQQGQRVSIGSTAFMGALEQEAESARQDKIVKPGKKPESIMSFVEM